MDELSTVIAEPTASPVATEIPIWRHFGEITANRIGWLEVLGFGAFVANLAVDFIGVPISSLVPQIPSSIQLTLNLGPQTFPGEATNLGHVHSCRSRYAR